MYSHLFSYFPQADLLARVPDVFAKLSIVYAVMQAIGLIVMCDPPNFVSFLCFTKYINLLNTTLCDGLQPIAI
jgi:hypothetical protein